MTPTLFSISYAGFWGQDSLDLSQFIPRAASLGYSAVMLAGKRPNLSPLDTDEETIGRMNELLAENNIECAVVAGYTDFAASRSEIPTVEFQIQYVESLARIARQLGCQIVRIFSAYRTQDRSFHDGWAEMTRVIAEVADRCASYDVTVALQNHHDFALATPALLEFLHDVDRPNLTLGFDAWSPALRGEFGDYCLLFPEDNPQLYLPNHANNLLDFAESKNALAIPHHLAYQRGWRGANFDFHRSVTSPVVEVMSEHGCSMSLSSPHDFVRHSMGGRSSFNTVDRQLANGLRFGFVGSSDSHTGYPGAYGEGVVGLWAPDLSRASIFEAIRNRCTYATTGERITVEFAINDHPMGSEIPFTDEREIKVRVEGQDLVLSIELIRNGRVIQRYFPQDECGDVKLPGRAKCRIRYGWGPWAQFQTDRVALWEMNIAVRGGKIRHAYPCFQHTPYSEEMLDHVDVGDDGSLQLVSPTARAGAFEEDPTKSIVLDLEGPTDAEVVVTTMKPSARTARAKLGYLAQDNKITFIGGFGEESFIIEKLVGPSEFGVTLTWNDKHDSKGAWYYVRVSQANGHQAWSSPIWVG